MNFYSEGIRCSGELFIPAGFGTAGKVPAVVLAPGRNQTASSVARYAARFAEHGLIAMTLDYRGWGRSGGFLQTPDPVKTDDRLRFSQMTARVLIRRKRVLPSQQILDIRNALYFLQGEPGVDPARVGVWGVDLAGGHVLAIAATDARVKAAVSQAPVLAGDGLPKQALRLSAELAHFERKRARIGWGTANGLAFDADTGIGMAGYFPFWYVEQIPASSAIMFVVAESDAAGRRNAENASRLLKGKTEVFRVPDLDSRSNPGSAFESAAAAAVAWFAKHL